MTDLKGFGIEYERLFTALGANDPVPVLLPAGPAGKCKALSLLFRSQVNTPSPANQIRMLDALEVALATLHANDLDIIIPAKVATGTTATTQDCETLNFLKAMDQLMSDASAQVSTCYNMENQSELYFYVKECVVK